MIVKTPGTVSVDHIMWQPQFKCVGNCGSCYIAKSSAAKYDGPVQTEILDLLKKGKVECKQLTLSLDTFFHPPKEFLDTLYEEFWNSDWVQKKEIDLCLTVHDPNSLTRYYAAMKMDRVRFLKPISLLSLSNLSVTGKVSKKVKEDCEQAQTTLIYNKMITNHTINMGRKAFRIGCRYADIVNLVFKKSKLGDPISSESYDVLEEALSIAKEETKGKIVIDQCKRDAENYYTTAGDEVCSAGISKLSVWPDGSVTACPYDTDHILEKKIMKEDGSGINTYAELVHVVEETVNFPMMECKMLDQAHPYSNWIPTFQEKSVEPQLEQS